MKKLILLCLILTSTQLYAQNELKQVNEAANKWLDAVMNRDFENARNISSESTKEHLSKFEKTWNLTFKDDNREKSAKDKLDYKVLEEQTMVDGDNAHVEIKLTSLKKTAYPEIELPIDLVRQNERWLIDLDMDALKTRIEYYEQLKMEMYDETGEEIDEQAGIAVAETAELAAGAEAAEDETFEPDPSVDVYEPASEDAGEAIDAAEVALLEAQTAVAVPEDSYTGEAMDEYELVSRDAIEAVEAAAEAAVEEFVYDDEGYVIVEDGNREISKTSKEQFDALHAVARTEDVKHEDALHASAEIIKIAEKWLWAYYTFDLETALEYSDQDTREFLGMIIDMVSRDPIPDSIMTLFKQTKVEIETEEKIVVLPEVARVNYTLLIPESVGLPPSSRTLYFRNVDGKWLVRYTMEDAMVEAQEYNQSEDDDYEETTYYDEEEVEFKPAGAAIEKATE